MNEFFIHNSQFLSAYLYTSYFILANEVDNFFETNKQENFLVQDRKSVV